MTSDGYKWNEGTYTADAWYDALRNDKRKPIQWPGRFVDKLSEREGVAEYFAAYGVETAA